MHLTEERLRRLLEGSLEPEEARRLADHLSGECTQCEALLAAAPPGALDGVVDEALTALAPVRPGEAGNDLEYARIRSRARAPARSGRGWRRGVAVAAAVAVAAGVAVEVVVERQHDARYDGEKGVGSVRAPAAPVRLSAVAVLGEAGAAPRLVRVVSGEVLPADAALELRVDVGQAADVVMARVGPAGDVDVFWHERATQPGAFALTLEGRPAAYPLAGLAGPQRFVALASARGLDPGRAASAARAVASGASSSDPSAGPHEELAHDVLEVTVR